MAVGAGADREALLEEFARLRHGWGLESENLQARVGPRLRRLCGYRSDAGDREIRRRILVVLQETWSEFPEADRVALAYALAAAPGTGLPLLSDRTALLADRIGTGERTARRRVKRAFERLADEVVARAAPDPDADDPEKGWYVRRLEALVRLDAAAPELIERRTIVARRDGLRRISTRFSLPRPLDDPNGDRADSVRASLYADVQQGARIDDRERLGEAHFRFLLGLPRALRQGEEHTYTIVFRMPEGQPFRPHYAFVPLTPCDVFQLRVRFDSERPPKAVWQFQQVAPRVLNDDPVPGERLSLDDAGEVVLEFREPETGFGYGVGWLP